METCVVYMGKNYFNNNKNCMNCKNVVADFLAYLNSYLDISPKTYDLISPMLQVRELSKNEVIVNDGEICIANKLGLQSSDLSWPRGEFRRRKSGLTKYLQIVFITLHFI